MELWELYEQMGLSRAVYERGEAALEALEGKN